MPAHFRVAQMIISTYFWSSCGPLKVWLPLFFSLLKFKLFSETKQYDLSQVI